MRPAPWTLALALSVTLAACGKPADQAKAPSPADQATAAAGALEKPGLTVRTIMDTLVDPAGDFLFESVQDISDDEGVHRKERLKDAADAGLKATAARDVPALSAALAALGKHEDAQTVTERARVATPEMA